MINLSKSRGLLLAVAGILFASGLSFAANNADWQQYRGPNRDGLSVEKGIAKQWPENGPKEVWRRDVGAAFSGMIVADGVLYTLDADAENEYLFAVNAKDGSEVWRKNLGEVFEDAFGNGPRSTPALHKGTLYALSARGLLVAVDAKDGKTRWQVDFKADFASEIPRWGFCASPLVVDDMLIVDTGGTEARAVTAFNLADGTVRWSSIEDTIAYSSPALVEHGGVRQLLILTKSGLHGLDLKGNVLWRTDFFPDLSITPAIPVLLEPDVVFLSASYDTGAKGVRLVQTDGKPGVEDLWTNKVMRNHFNPSLAYGKHVYGFDNSTLKCVNPVTGEQVWAKRGFGKGSLIYVDGHFILLSERGKLHLIEATHEGYREKSAHQVLSGRSWTSPTIAGGKLYVRNRTQMVCLELAP